MNTTSSNSLPQGFELLSEEQKNRLFYVEQLEQRLELSAFGLPGEHTSTQVWDTTNNQKSCTSTQ